MQELEVRNSFHQVDVESFVERWIPGASCGAMIRSGAVLCGQMLDPPSARVAPPGARPANELNRHVRRLLHIRGEEDADVAMFLPNVPCGSSAISEVNG